MFFRSTSTPCAQRVEGLTWVRFATVQRVLPDTISIKIVEREPVGLAQNPWRDLSVRCDRPSCSIRIAERGVNFPILDGLEVDDTEANQKKIDLYLRIMEDLHGQNELSEIHINDAGEVSVVSLSDPLLVNLGAERIQGPVGTLPPVEEHRFRRSIRRPSRWISVSRTR